MSLKTAHSKVKFDAIVRDISDRAAAAARNAGTWSAESDKMTTWQSVCVVSSSVLTSLMLGVWMWCAVASIIH